MVLRVESIRADVETADSAFVMRITGVQSQLYAYICTLLGKTAGAADVLQEANLVLWKKAGDYDPTRPFEPWAYKIAYVQVLAYRKRLSRDRLTFDDEMLAQVDAAFRNCSASFNQELELLNACIEKLPPEHRRLVEGRYHRGESVNAMAGQVKKSPNTVAAMLYRIRKVLHDCVQVNLAEVSQ